MGFHKKIVAVITLFYTGISGLFLVSGVGAPPVRLAALTIFLLGALNLSVYWREFGRWVKSTACTARGHLSEAGQQLKNKKREAQVKAQKKASVAKAKSKPVRTVAAKPPRAAVDKDDFTDDDFAEVDDDFEFEDDDKTK